MARAPRNKTIALDAAQTKHYFERTVTVSDNVDIAEVTDKTVCGDSTEVMKHLPDGFADLIIADPPYNLSKNFGTVDFKAMTLQQYEQYTEVWLSQVCAKLAPHGSIYVCCDWRSSSVIQEVLQRHVTILNRITWEREKGRGAKANWKNSMEDIWFGVRDPKNYCFDIDAVRIKRRVLAPYSDNGKPRDWRSENGKKFRLTCPSNLWNDITVPYWSMPENTEHPTQKPEKLIAKLILASSREQDTVFDPFLGSGTTSVVARKLNRHFVGIELSPEYCAVAERRLEAALDDNSIQGYTAGVFWERNTQVAQNKTK